MEPIVGTVREDRGGGTRSAAERLALTKSTSKRRLWWSWRMIQMSVSGQVSHLSRGAGQVAPAPVMWRNWWEAYVDQSLWAGSCPSHMADSQPWLTMQRCGQRTDGWNILSHRNFWNVCNIQMLRICCMMFDWVFLFLFVCFFSQSCNFLIWNAFLMLQSADAKTIDHDLAFIKKHYWWKCEVLAKSLERVNEFFHFSSLISLLAVSYLPPFLQNSNS